MSKQQDPPLSVAPVQSPVADLREGCAPLRPVASGFLDAEMDKRIDERLEALKDEIAAEVARRVVVEMAKLAATLNAPPAESVSRKEACRRLGIGLTKLKGLIRRGEISPSKLGIPVEEIHRLAQPVRETPRRAGGAPRKRPYNAKAEAARGRDLLKKR